MKADVNESVWAIVAALSYLASGVIDYLLSVFVLIGIIILFSAGDMLQEGDQGSGVQKNPSGSIAGHPCQLENQW